MKGYKEKTLNSMSRKQLVALVLCLQNNHAAILQTLNTQYDNYLKYIAVVEEKKQ